MNRWMKEWMNEGTVLFPHHFLRLPICRQFAVKWAERKRDADVRQLAHNITDQTIYALHFVMALTSAVPVTITAGTQMKHNWCPPSSPSLSHHYHIALMSAQITRWTFFHRQLFCVSSMAAAAADMHKSRLNGAWINEVSEQAKSNGRNLFATWKRSEKCTFGRHIIGCNGKRRRIL